jgi:TPR repeat protein
MPERRTIIFNSLLTLILFATIYQFIKSEYLGREVNSIDRGVQRAQQQIGELKEAASATFEQTMRRFDVFSRQLDTMASASKNSSTAKLAAEKSDRGNQRAGSDRASRALGQAGSAIKRAQSTLQTPTGQRREQEIKLNRDRLQFLRMRAAVCDTRPTGKLKEARMKRCNERTRRLAGQGNSAAQEWLGVEARDRQHDLQLAILWFERAANQGDVEAMDNLASIYAGSARQTNEIVSDALADPMKTLYWYSKSAGLGDPNAMGAIARIYQEGRLTAQDQREAVVWYEMAAKAVASGDKRRMASANFAAVLGAMYYNGDGIDQDKIQAYEWYDIACVEAARLNAHADSSCASRDNVAGELRPVDVAKAQALAAEWVRLHGNVARVERNDQRSWRGERVDLR